MKESGVIVRLIDSSHTQSQEKLKRDQPVRFRYIRCNQIHYYLDSPFYPIFHYLISSFVIIVQVTHLP